LRLRALLHRLAATRPRAQPAPVWEAAAAAHPALLVALTLLRLAGLVATLAVLAGGLPLVVSALAQSIAARHRGLLGDGRPLPSATKAHLAKGAIDPAAARQVSEALGHNRLDVTTTHYLC
jgi:hypothetical protein